MSRNVRSLLLALVIAAPALLSSPAQMKDLAPTGPTPQGKSQPSYCLPGTVGPRCTLPENPASADDLKECYSGTGDSIIVAIVNQAVDIRFSGRHGDEFDMRFVKVQGHTGGETIFHGEARVHDNGRFEATAVCDEGGGCYLPDPVTLKLSGHLSVDGGAIQFDLNATGCFSNTFGEPDACVFPELAFVQVRQAACP